MVNEGLIQDFEIVANKLFVRFLPQDSTHSAALTSNSTLELFDHPLDYEVLTEGTTSPLMAYGIVTAFGNDVKIDVSDDGNPPTTDDIYEVMMHELGHISHFLKSPLNWTLVSGIVRESWGIVVEYYFLDAYYPDYAFADGDFDQDRTTIIGTDSREWKYTPVFIDLIDNTNQRAENNGSTEFAEDLVEGYTLAQIQDALDHRTTLSGVFEHLKNNYSNPTENHLDTLLDFYQDIIDDH